MKKLLILSLALSLLILPLSGCYCSQEELDDAYNEGFDIGYAQGFAEGKTEGYIEGLRDCPDGPFVGSINSDVYHYPWCITAQQILPENEVWFDSVEEAQDAGYRPCKVCNPPG